MASCLATTTTHVISTTAQSAGMWLTKMLKSGKFAIIVQTPNLACTLYVMPCTWDKNAEATWLTISLQEHKMHVRGALATDKSQLSLLVQSLIHYTDFNAVRRI